MTGNSICQQEFMSVLRPDAPDGTFDIVGIDKGITDTGTKGTVEAVSSP